MKNKGVNTVRGLLNSLSERADKLARKDKEAQYKKYKSLVEAVLDVYKNADSNSSLDDLNRRGSIDAFAKYYPFDRGDVEDWPNRIQEKTFKAANEIYQLLRVGYFNELERIMEKEGYSNDFHRFMVKVIKPKLIRIANNEGWNWRS